jgi:hypothetical protein
LLIVDDYKCLAAASLPVVPVLLLLVFIESSITICRIFCSNTNLVERENNLILDNIIVTSLDNVFKKISSSLNRYQIANYGLEFGPNKLLVN